jgi:two-component system chemotaxis sensor kinase CheA
MNKLLAYLTLPPQISAFERTYLGRMNRVGAWFFALHPPLLAVVAWVAGTGPLQAIVLGALTAAGPIFAWKRLENPRHVGLVYGFTAMAMGGLLVHFGQGPMQIEMHFYFFVLLALLAMFANPMAIVVAAVTAAVHHLTLWVLLPESVFNYDAPIWTVVVHAAFVVLESAAACFVARSFFDSVIGLEKIVERRTSELAGRNKDMRVVMDHVHEGLLTIDRDAKVSPEFSREVELLFGAIEPGTDLGAIFDRHDPKVATWFRLGYEALFDGFMPREVCLDQLPREMRLVDGRTLRLSWQPIEGASGDLAKVLVVAEDVTAQVAQQAAEEENAEILRCFQRLMADRAGFLEFLDEARALVERLGEGGDDLATEKRLVHTLKGNSGFLGLGRLAKLCHQVEEGIEEAGFLSEAGRAKLGDWWRGFSARLEGLFDQHRADNVELDEAALKDILEAVLRGRSRGELLRMIQAWRLEPTAQRLARFSEQVERLAMRLGKCEVTAVVDDQGLRLSPDRWRGLWAAMTHAVRNAVDHGLETPEERAASGKSPVASIRLSAREEAGFVVVGVHDDGRGIDWVRVKAKAEARGLAHATHDDLVSALFVDGLSTRDEASETSGRGVGMSALKVAVSELGGHVRVTSTPGVGTSLELFVPAIDETRSVPLPALSPSLQLAARS